MASVPPDFDRTIRVFVSSTFRDMQAERDELILRVFPQLRRLCQERGVTWSEVDLRWGITEEQSQRGDVLPICLEEIRRCRPYFIGLLGERYGWVPHAIPAEVIEREPWIREYADSADKTQQKSVTELEILHGVLNNPEIADQALFYFRDPGYVETVPQESRNDYTPEDAASTDKLARLKDNIRQQHLRGNLKYPPRENYRDAKALGELVLADFTALIDVRFPAGTEPSPLERRRMDHEAFARSRADAYIGRQEYFDRLDAHVAGDTPPLVVLGESGGGKSALLANWALKYRERHPDDFLLWHFIGASADSTNWISMLRRILSDLKLRFGLEGELPENPDELRSAFADRLLQVSQRGRLVLVIDALNQLDDREGAPDLVWLPSVIPPGVRLIVSTLPGRAQRELQSRGWPVLTIQPLETDERERLIHEYLAQFRKRLSDERATRIIDSPQAGNPLFLRAILDELRVFGIHERLDERIDHYLSASTISDLYQRILARYEHDYDPDGSGVVRDAMSLLWAARRGLTEAELLELLGQNDRPLPKARWSPISLAAEQSLISRGGLIGFFHEHLGRAVQERYLAADELRIAAHRRLVSHFRRLPLGPRKVDELPWQLAVSRSFDQLAGLLSNPDFCDYAWKSNPYDVLEFWNRIEEHTEISLLESFRPVLLEPYNHRPYLTSLCELFRLCRHDLAALWLLKKGVGARSEDLNQHFVGCLTEHTGVFRFYDGDLDEALARFARSGEIYRQAGERVAYAHCLYNRSLALVQKRDFDGGAAAVAAVEPLAPERTRPWLLRWCRLLQAELAIASERYDDAHSLGDLAETQAREQGDQRLVACCRRLQAQLLVRRGSKEQALSLLRDVLPQVDSADVGPETFQCLNLQRQLLQELGRETEAAVAQATIDRIVAEIERKRAQFQNALEEKSADRASEPDSRDSSSREMTEIERHCSRLRVTADGDLWQRVSLLHLESIMAQTMDFGGSVCGFASCFSKQITDLIESRHYDAAIDLLDQQVLTCRGLGRNEGLRFCFHFLAAAHQRRGSTKVAVAYLQEEEALCRELEDQTSLKKNLENQILLCHELCDFPQAATACRSLAQVCEVAGDLQTRAAALGELAGLLEQFDVRAAVKAHDDVAAVCRRLGNPAGAAECHWKQAQLLLTLNDLDGALAAARRHEQIHRELVNRRQVCLSVGMQATVLKGQGRVAEARDLNRQAVEISRELGFREGLKEFLRRAAENHLALQEYEQAARLLEEHEAVCRELRDEGELRKNALLKADVLRARGETDGALEVLQGIKAGGGPGKSRRDEARWLGMRAQALEEAGRLPEAMELLKRQEAICREIGDQAQLCQVCLPLQSYILRSTGDLRAALQPCSEAIRIATEIRDDDSKQGLLWNKAMFHRQLKEIDEALAALHEREKCCLRLEKLAEYSETINLIGVLSFERKDFAECLASLQREERVLRKYGVIERLTECLDQQALIHVERGDVAQALQCAAEEEQVSKEHRNRKGFARAATLQAQLIASTDLPRAEAFAEAKRRELRELFNG